MKETYSVGKFSELTGIPVRTLHYYEEMGLIKPHRQAVGIGYINSRTWWNYRKY
ncbi:MerR family DNA-binding transcriptional regulator [Bacillus circulans]|nr:MerR family DNA-binding transcriptional regulator [Niallia circulans]